MDGTLKHPPHRDVPQLELVADEENALRISQLKLVGKVMTEKSASDKNRIWNKRPWSIDGAHLIMKEWKLKLTFDDLNFNLSTFWVQIHGLPLQFLTKENAMKIEGLFHKVLNCECTSRTNLIGLKYMRIQVEVDISEPLPIGFNFLMKEWQNSITPVGELVTTKTLALTYRTSSKILKGISMVHGFGLRVNLDAKATKVGKELEANKAKTRSDQVDTLVRKVHRPIPIGTQDRETNTGPSIQTETQDIEPINHLNTELRATGPSHTDLDDKVKRLGGKRK
ncbi:hypothetical protein FEM48_Zijuj05G0138200 [Ziziphus jujuba var. spinosa]|uniref:DUF4283 domain-containing protein n=1 Tax=Ziziphus jujuba var. spinosa TaxID=714518 RepID=A0A978VF70_ZIZJJ|nr:hypothetical protein FEM48_Zijuj05G0138200 [Ziziphus jujuba var. spinosa]